MGRPKIGQRLSVTLPPELLQLVEDTAAALDCSLSEAVRALISNLADQVSPPELSSWSGGRMTVGDGLDSPPPEPRPPAPALEPPLGPHPRESSDRVPVVASGCEHPKKRQQVFSYGTWCGACGERVR